MKKPALSVFNSGMLLKKYIEDARDFWEINLYAQTRHNGSLIPPAKWSVNETTQDSIMIEYSDDIRLCQSWGLKHIAFHEICHVKQALDGLPFVCIETDDKEIKVRKGSDAVLKEKFNICALNMEQISDEICMPKKEAEMFLRNCYVMATDVLVNTELIKASPVGLDTARFGIIVLGGDYKLLDDPRERLGGIIESGMWIAVLNNAGSSIRSELAKSLLERDSLLLERASSVYGIDANSYRLYVDTLSSFRFSRITTDFAASLKAIMKSVIPLAQQTNSSFSGFSKKTNN